MYSPIDEANAAVTSVAPLYYGMLLVSQAGVGPMLNTAVSAGTLALSAYAIALADGFTRIVLVNKDGTLGANVRVEVRRTLTAASAIYLEAPSLGALSGVTLGGTEVTPTGDWTPEPPYPLTTSGTSLSIVVPPASAALVQAR